MFTLFLGVIYLEAIRYYMPTPLKTKVAEYSYGIIGITDYNEPVTGYYWATEGDVRHARSTMTLVLPSHARTHARLRRAIR